MKWMPSRKEKAHKKRTNSKTNRGHNRQSVAVIVKRQHEGITMEQDWDSLSNLAKENGRSKDKEGMVKIWKEKK